MQFNYYECEGLTVRSMYYVEEISTEANIQAN